MKREIEPKRPVYPTPAALITSVDDDGKPNIITLGETFNISIREPVIVGIAIRPATYTHGLICRTWEYVVNLPPASILDKVLYVGSVSGRDVDKFAETGLTPLPAKHVRPPLIAECPVNLECKVQGIHRIGDHDLFLGEVVAEHVNEECLDESDRLIVEKLECYSMVHGGFYTLGNRLEAKR